MPKHPEYRELWEKAGYTLEMGSQEACLPPPGKFLRAYHLTTTEYALSAIALGRLKVARLSELNDPFELLALNLKGTRRRKVMEDFKNALDSTQGILCFSRDWMNPVIWSHYADRHRGICLGFNLRRDLAVEVDYSDERLRQQLDENKHSTRLTADQESLLRRTKLRDWQYEREIRLYVDLGVATKEGSLYFRNFDDDLSLAEVIVGIRCPISIDRLRDFVSARYASVVTFGARPGVKRFQVVRDEDTVP